MTLRKLTLIISVFFFPAFVDAHVSTLPSAGYVLPQVAKEWLKEKKEVTFIDVREAKEFNAGHIHGAMNIPYYNIEKRAKEITRGHPVITYCTYSAWRAPYAANVLADLGFKNVYILEGGISAWNAGGQVIYAFNSGQKASIIPYSKSDPIILNHPPDKKYFGIKAFTLQELSVYNGQDGHPAYVAVNGVIYDLTQSRLWRGGVHAPSQGRATAGRDLTDVIVCSPHGDKILKNFPIVGRLIF